MWERFSASMIAAGMPLSHEAGYGALRHPHAETKFPFAPFVEGGRKV
jgi:hypothetical protein